MRKIILYIIIALLLPITMVGQYLLQHNQELDSFNSIPKEDVFIHFNDNLLLSGEYLYYKFYCLNAENRTPSDISKIGYVALIGKGDKLIFQHKIKLVDGQGQGDFFVPVDILTGHYKLIAYTQWMLNDGEQSSFVADLAIVNPYQELPKITKQSSPVVLIHTKSDSTFGIPKSDKKINTFEIQLPKRTYGKRQLVKFGIKEITKQGMSNLSISVRKIDSIVVPFQKKSSANSETKTISKNKRELRLNDLIYLPELRGELISGRIISKTSKQPTTNENISLSITGDNGLTKVARSNENGMFYFNLDTGLRNDQLIFDLLDGNKSEVEIILDSSSINMTSYNFKEMAISPDLSPVFEQRSIYNQIENAFSEQKADSTIVTSYTIPAYKDFQEIYDLDDYTRFPTMQETIVEIIDNVLITKRKGEYTIQVRGMEKFLIDSEDAPLILLDNVLVQNVNNLLEYDVQTIQRIGISRNEFYIGSMKYQGVFSVETKDGDSSTTIPSQKSLIFKLSGPIAIKKYYEQDYSSRTLKNYERSADFRQQLLWLPNVKINKIGTFQFYTSDNSGTYEISVEGFGKNGGGFSLLEKLYVE